MSTPPLETKRDNLGPSVDVVGMDGFVMIKRGIYQLIEVIEGRIFEMSEPIPRGRGQERESKGTLLPPLDDKLVLRRIWPLLHKRVNVSLLWRLRRVNRVWREKVGTTVEWAALEMVRLDSPGYLRYFADRSERQPSLHERVESELSAFTILLSEHLLSFASRSEMVLPRTDRLRAVEGERGRHLDEVGSEESESEDPFNYSCRKRRCAYHEGCTNRISIEFDRSEEEEVKAYASSTDSSMRVYYPRHLVRIR